MSDEEIMWEEMLDALRIALNILAAILIWKWGIL
jgi:hypothetical protein